MSNCMICGGSSEFAVNWLISTRHVRPRRQKCSCSVVLCESCLHGICHGAGTNLPVCLRQSLHEVYTATAQLSEEGL